VSKSGLVFVMEHDGRLVGTSTSQPIHESRILNMGVKLQRINAKDSRDPLIQATAQFLVNRYGDFKAVIADQRLSFANKGSRNIVKVVPFRDELGLDWLIVVVIPEADYKHQINAGDLEMLIPIIIMLSASAILAGYIFYGSGFKSSH
jgi:hypothetical protein